MLVTDVSNFNDILPRLRAAAYLVVDLETQGVRPFSGQRLCGIAIWTPQDDCSYYFSFRHAEGNNLPLEVLPELLNIIWSKPSIGWNYKFDVLFLLQEQVFTEPPVDMRDVMTAAFLMNENEENFKLKDTAVWYLDVHSADAQEALVDELRRRKLGKGDIWHLPAVLVAPYAETDVRLTARLYDFYSHHLQRWSLYSLWEDYNAYLRVLTRLEFHGMLLDVLLIQEYIQESAERSVVIQAEIEQAAGYKINLNSSKQVQAWLHLRSTAKDILETMQDEHPHIKLLLEFRQWSKVSGTYYRPYLEFMDKAASIHPNFNIIGTYTGRLSCSGPNMQAIPRKDEEHSSTYKVKNVFLARPGRVLIQADYSQAEIRVASFYAKEERMLALLAQGADIHTITAQRLNIPRHVAKTLNFSVIYGIGAAALAKNLRVSEKEARAFLNAYRAEYPGFRKLYYKAQEVATERGFIQFFTGRLRRFNTNTARTPFTHNASSNLIQGTVADITRLAMTRLDRELPEARQILTVHDSIIFEVQQEDLFECLPIIKNTMEDIPPFDLKVDIAYGECWGKLTDWDKK